MSRAADCQSGWALREHLLQPPSCANRETEVQREAMSFPGQCIVGLVSIGIRKWENLPGAFGDLLLDLYMLLTTWGSVSISEQWWAWAGIQIQYVILCSSSRFIWKTCSYLHSPKPQVITPVQDVHGWGFKEKFQTNAFILLCSTKSIWENKPDPGHWNSIRWRKPTCSKSLQLSKNNILSKQQIC